MIVSPPKLKRHEAEELATEARRWECESCDRFIEEDREGPHCISCEMYWQDVSAGVFDDW